MATKINRINRANGVAKNVDIAKQRLSDAFTQSLIDNRRIRSNFHNLLKDACFEPENVKVKGGYILSSMSTIRQLADVVKLNRFDDSQKKALASLVDACDRTKIIQSYGCHDYIIGLANLAKWESVWIRDPALWRPDSKNQHRQFASLIRFLLCKYEVPAFMDKVWYGRDNNDLYQEWFINIGNGENIRKQKRLPIELTKKMAHCFLQAKSSFEIKEAIRWGHVKGMGADDRTALGILATPLGKDFSNNEFWESVIRFFMDNPMMDTFQYGAIYDYIANQKFRDRGNVYVDDKLVHLGPPQPNFSMHKRDPNALIAQVELWHRNIQRDQVRLGKHRQDCSWESCGIPGYVKKGKEETLSIEEILTSRDLYAEGESMKHCVGSYLDSCVKHRSAIFSMRRTVNSNFGFSRDATIEVNIAERKITQAKKSCNRNLTASDWNHLSEWVKKSQLQISTWIMR